MAGEWQAARAAARRSDRRRVLTFDAWKACVDRIIIKRIGLSADDLPDWSYRDAYDEGCSASEAAARAIRYARDC